VKIEPSKSVKSNQR